MTQIFEPSFRPLGGMADCLLGRAGLGQQLVVCLSAVVGAVRAAKPEPKFARTGVKHTDGYFSGRITRPTFCRFISHCRYSTIPHGTVGSRRAVRVTARCVRGVETGA